jgi:hypothetical protein
MLHIPGPPDDSLGLDNFPQRRKTFMVALLAFCLFLSPVSSTLVLGADAKGGM